MKSNIWINKKLLVMVALVLMSFLIVGCSLTQEDSSKKNVGDLKEASLGESGSWKTQINENIVNVELTPRDYKDGKLIFDMVVSTHSVDDLDTYDLKKITILNFEGKDYKPVSAPQLKGHHTSDELVFEISQKPTAFKITVTNLNSEGVREFNW